MIRPKFASTFTVAFVVALGVSCTTAASTYAVGDWRGGFSGSLYPLLLIFFALTLPLALLLGLTTLWGPSSGPRDRSTLKIAVSAVAVALVYAYLVARFYLKPTSPLGTVQLFCYWLAGAICVILIARARAYGLPWAIVVVLLTIFLPKPLYIKLSHNQRLTVVFVRVQPRTATSIGFADETDPDAALQCGPRDAMTYAGLHLLQARYPDQDLRILTYSTTGEGEPSLAIVLLRGPVQEPVALAEPYRSTVFYSQGPASWEHAPPDARMLNRRITIRPSPNADDLGLFMVEEAGGRAAGMAIRTPN
jgi:hypothetical protein